MGGFHIYNKQTCSKQSCKYKNKKSHCIKYDTNVKNCTNNNTSNLNFVRSAHRKPSCKCIKHFILHTYITSNYGSPTLSITLPLYCNHHHYNYHHPFTSQKCITLVSNLFRDVLLTQNSYPGNESSTHRAMKYNLLCSFDLFFTSTK